MADANAFASDRDDRTAPQERRLRFPWRLALLSLVLAFGLLGSRPIWDPVEGRYSNVALNILESDDWIHPMRNHEEGHWTKPPLTYWMVAASVGVFGYQPWAARLPVALLPMLAIIAMQYLGPAERRVPFPHWPGLRAAAAPLRPAQWRLALRSEAGARQPAPAAADRR